MAYLTGGLAWDNVRAGQPGFTTTADRAGWTAGLGVEALLNPNWSIKLEYLYAWFNDTGYTVAIPVSVQQRDISMLRLGVNYHFR